MTFNNYKQNPNNSHHNSTVGKYIFGAGSVVTPLLRPGRPTPLLSRPPGSGRPSDPTPVASRRLREAVRLHSCPVPPTQGGRPTPLLSRPADSGRPPDSTPVPSRRLREAVRLRLCHVRLQRKRSPRPPCLHHWAVPCSDSGPGCGEAARRGGAGGASSRCRHRTVGAAGDAAAMAAPCSEVSGRKVSTVLPWQLIIEE